MSLTNFKLSCLVLELLMHQKNKKHLQHDCPSVTTHLTEDHGVDDDIDTDNCGPKQQIEDRLNCQTFQF